jgi:Protein of unknown function (DUF3489)
MAQLEALDVKGLLKANGIASILAGDPVVIILLPKIPVAISPSPGDGCDDRHPVQEKPTSTNTSDAEKTRDPSLPEAKRKHTAARRPLGEKKAECAKKPDYKPKADRANRNAEVIALITRASGRDAFDEIVAATGWQKQTARGFVSIHRNKGREKVESSKSDAGERTYRIAELAALVVIGRR